MTCRHGSACFSILAGSIYACNGLAVLWAASVRTALLRIVLLAPLLTSWLMAATAPIVSQSRRIMASGPLASLDGVWIHSWSFPVSIPSRYSAYCVRQSHRLALSTLPASMVVLASPCPVTYNSRSCWAIQVVILTGAGGSVGCWSSGG